MHNDRTAYVVGPGTGLGELKGQAAEAHRAVVSDATRSLDQGPGEERFLLEVAGASEILRGVDATAIPALRNYAYTRVREGAEPVLEIARPDRRDPVLAVWQYGLGRVAAFTAEMRDDARLWRAWNDSGRLWAQLVRWTARPEGVLAHAFEVDREGDALRLGVRTFDPGCEDEVLRLRLQLGERETRDLPLAPTAPCLFETLASGIPAGRWPVTVVRRHADGTAGEQRQMVMFPSTEEAHREEYRVSVPDRAFLKRLTEPTGGTLNPDPGTVVRRRPGKRRRRYLLDSVLLPLAMFLFFGDVAARRRAPQTAPGGHLV